MSVGGCCQEFSAMTQGFEFVMSEWKVFIGRVSVFLTATPMSPPPGPAELYRMMWGDDPDSFQKAPNPLAASIAQGRRNGITMTCTVQPARIDFNLMGAPIQASELALIPAAQVNSELRRMIEVMQEGTISLTASRVALFVQFLTPTVGIVDGNKILASTIPYGINLSDEKDVVFQVNRPYKSKQAPPVDMNAIIKWSVDNLQILAFALPTGGAAGPAGAPIPQVRQVIAASVTFDVNNHPGQAVILDNGQQSVILLEALDFVSRTQREIGLNIKGF